MQFLCQYFNLIIVFIDIKLKNLPEIFQILNLETPRNTWNFYLKSPVKNDVTEYFSPYLFGYCKGYNPQYALVAMLER